MAVVGDHHDGAVEVVQQRAEALAARHVQVRLGLVEQQHVGAAREAGGERDELALPAGELRRRHVEGLDAERPQVAERLTRGAVAAGLGPGGQDALVVRERAGHPVQVGRQRRVGEARLRGVQVGLQRRQLGAGVAHGRQRVALVAVDDLRQVGEDEPAAARDRAGVRVVEPGEDPHQRRLPAAVGAEDADPRARLDVEIHAAQDAPAAEGLRDPTGGELRHGRHIR